MYRYFARSYGERAHRESSMSKLDYDAKRVANVYMELLCQKACSAIQIGVRCSHGLHEHHKQPANVLAANWMLGKPAFSFCHITTFA